MSATEMIYKIIDEKCLKQSAVARAAGYDPKKFNALLRGRKKMTSEDVVPICKALGVTPNELPSDRLKGPITRTILPQKGEKRNENEDTGALPDRHCAADRRGRGGRQRHL